MSSRFGSEPHFEEGFRLINEELIGLKRGNTERNESYEIFFDPVTRRFAAKEAKYTIACTLKIFLSENILVLLAIGLIGYTIYIIFCKYQDKKALNKLAQKIYSEIVIDLNRRKTRCVKELYEKSARKYGEATMEAVWPLIENLRLKYKQILVFKDEFRGSYEVFWRI